MKLNKKKIKFIVRKMKQGMTTYQISKLMAVSISRVYQIWRKYNETGATPAVGLRSGRQKKNYLLIK